jgi:hypothetical protein
MDPYIRFNIWQIRTAWEMNASEKRRLLKRS